MRRVALVALLTAGGAHAAPTTIFDAQGTAHGTGFIGHKTGLIDAAKRVYFTPSEDELADTPAIYDSRNDAGVNYVAPVRDQGQCGSCWDFSMTKTLESSRLVNGLSPLDLSEQDALENAGMYGCDGGDMDASYWVNHGLALESDCPYTASDRPRCTKPAADKGATWGFVGAQGRAPTEDELRAAIYKYKVLSITVAAGGSDWSSGGKMTGCRSTGINHMVNLVGYDCSGNAVHDVLGIKVGIGAKKCVFYGRNSWGTRWGDNGDFYAVQGCNQMASTEDSALFITHEGTPVPPPGPTPPPPGPTPPPPGPTPVPTDLPNPVLPIEVTVGAGDPVMLGTAAESGVTYLWSTGETTSMVMATFAADKAVTLKASNGKGTTKVQTRVHVVAQRKAG